MTALPQGFRAHAANIGIKDRTLDFAVVAADDPVPAVGLFTRSRFAGPSVEISRRNLADRSARAVVVGNPARVVKTLDELEYENGERVYPPADC